MEGQTATELLIHSGALGIVVVAIAWLVIQNWPKLRRVSEASSLVLNPNQMVEWHRENRDVIRETSATTKNIEKMQDRELEHLNAIVAGCARIAEAVDRMEARQGNESPAQLGRMLARLQENTTRLEEGYAKLRNTVERRRAKSR